MRIPLLAGAIGLLLAGAVFGVAPTKQDLTFTASDGAQLHAVVRSSGALVRRPLIIELSPYGQGSDVPDFGPAYNHVYVNARGTGRSTGVWTAVGPRDQLDVSEFVAWACHQPWSNGHIGLYGFSASAIAVYNSMHLPLACVDAAALKAGTADLYRDLLYPGGTMNLVPGAAVGLGVGAPIVLGGMANLVQNGPAPTESFLSGAGFLGTALQVLAHVREDDFWLGRTQRPGPNRFPVLAATGFYDVESRGPFESYKMLRDQGIRVHLLVVGAHDGVPAGTPGPVPAFQRWFDRFLLHDRNGIEKEPRVQLLVGHGGYEAQIAGAVTRRLAKDWPVPGTRWQRLYLSPGRDGSARSLNDGRLTAAVPARRAVQAYPAITSLPMATDPNTTAVVSAAGAGMLFNALPILTQLAVVEPLALTFTTPVFTRDVDVVGPASLDVFVATILPEGDLHAVIADVWPDGSAHAVGLGRLRTSYPDVDPDRSVTDANGEIVQPYAKHDRKTPAPPGKVREYHVEFWPIGNRFEPQHRLRLYLVGAPTYALPSPNLDLVSIGGDTPSRLLLPVLPGSDACASMGSPC